MQITEGSYLRSVQNVFVLHIPCAPQRGITKSCRGRVAGVVRANRPKNKQEQEWEW